MSLFAQIRQRLITTTQPAPRWMERDDFLRLSRQLRSQPLRLPDARQARRDDDWLAVPA